MTTIVWFRRDLRVHDHPALAAAVAAGEIVPLFVFDPALLHGRHASPARARFMLGSLHALRDALRERGADIMLRSGRPDVVLPQVAREAGANAVHVSRDYGPYARWRDAAVRDELAHAGVHFWEFPGVLAREPEDIANGAGAPYRVYTPFARAWERAPLREPIDAPARIPCRAIESGEMPAEADIGAGGDAAIVPPGEDAARERLDRWARAGIEGYAARRDMLSEDGTSRLSADLRWGLISPVQVLQRLDGGGEDARRFRAQIAWRDFYYHILFHFPHVTRQPFRPEFERVPWRNDPAAIDAWQRGLTGVPIVDAAMRQLLALGWMHNRARMIVASFLTKHLLVDWRIGEHHFMRHLVDGDLANNNGGWQWAASTGTDPQPYFRVFNPVLQSKRHDPRGIYIRRYVPELRNVDDRYIHEPWLMPEEAQSASGCVIGRDYPSPIVELAGARQRAVNAYARAAGGG